MSSEWFTPLLGSRHTISTLQPCVVRAGRIQNYEVDEVLSNLPNVYILGPPLLIAPFVPNRLTPIHASTGGPCEGYDSRERMLHFSLAGLFNCGDRSFHWCKNFKVPVRQGKTKIAVSIVRLASVSNRSSKLAIEAMATIVELETPLCFLSCRKVKFRPGLTMI
jgi:hypothetical protein